MVLACRFLIPPEDFVAWGWRVPFLLSIILLVISLWMRLKLSESPVFQAMKAAGETAKNPFVESFTYPGNKKRIFIALFGITGGLTTIWYTAFFSGLSFLKGPMRVDDTTAEILIGISGFIAMSFYIFFGKLSDKIGRKKPIIWGNIFTLILLFPAFWTLGQLANPALSESAEFAPVTVSGPNCDYDPFADVQAARCGRILEDLTASGVPYSVVESATLRVSAGSTTIPLDTYPWDKPSARKAQLQEALTKAGYSFEDIHPPLLNMLGIIGVLLVLGGLSAMTYGSVAALLSEMFPAHIRYSSMSIPYHIGSGYLGGFLPLIAGYIIARTGDSYAGLWYTWVIVAIGLVVGWWGIPDGPPRDFDENG